LNSGLTEAAMLCCMWCGLHYVGAKSCLREHTRKRSLLRKKPHQKPPFCYTKPGIKVLLCIC